ncbi:hypothetical protein BMS3Abin10_02353 [bacterium BMS3Abin10]|nr:hypothetical protein BMS3Abin10_02353 [bacterium BMS3Abin10]GBE39689.1 hypothetical protein BMS3Bbin08_02320 [bacterium BMS3Bbin08]HDH50939.1 hypothetical protein [Nitrospirota bacterium]HDK17372.1 hypothetical protein [Nitrospirota bacterium]HDK41445.1 hypothetical protein [Nitrospirota bacterium]
MEERKLITLDLATLSEDVIDVLLMDSTAEDSLFDELARKNTHRPEVLRLILKNEKTPNAVKQFAAKALNEPLAEADMAVPVTEAPGTEAETYEEHEFRVQTLFQRVQQMKVGEKIQLALRGSRDIRSILLRDTNKEVMITVLDNPKLTDSEIELMAKQRTTPDDILRKIAKNREWLRNYPIVHALISNPKTPIPIAIKNLVKIKQKDLALLEKNRNIPETVRAAIKRRMSGKRR